MRIKKLVLTAILTALSIVFNEFLSIPIPPTNSPLLTLSFGMIPIFFISYFAGPIYSLIGAIASDLLGYFLIGASKGYVFHPGFTISAIFGSLVFSLILKLKDKLNNKKGLLLFSLIISSITLITIPLFSFLYFKTGIDDMFSVKGLVIVVDVISVLLNISLIIYEIQTYQKKNSNAIMISISIYYFINSLILTPLWLYHMSNYTINFFYLWVTRLITTPINIIVYVLLIKLLLIPLDKLNISRQTKKGS